MGDPVKDKKVYFVPLFRLFFWETELCLGFRGQCPRGLYVDTKRRVGGLFCYLEQVRKENVGFRVFCWGNKGMSFGGKYREGCTSCYISSMSHKRKGKSVISLSYLILLPNHLHFPNGGEKRNNQAIILIRDPFFPLSFFGLAAPTNQRQVSTDCCVSTKRENVISLTNISFPHL